MDKQKDLVCKMDVTPKEEVSFDFEGSKYYFCSDFCKDKFVADPAKYLENEQAE